VVLAVAVVVRQVKMAMAPLDQHLVGHIMFLVLVDQETVVVVARGEQGLPLGLVMPGGMVQNIAHPQHLDQVVVVVVRQGVMLHLASRVELLVLMARAAGVAVVEVLGHLATPIQGVLGRLAMAVFLLSP
jgi:hypothetical protein